MVSFTHQNLTVEGIFLQNNIWEQIRILLLERKWDKLEEPIFLALNRGHIFSFALGLTKDATGISLQPDHLHLGVCPWWNLSKGGINQEQEAPF